MKNTLSYTNLAFNTPPNNCPILKAKSYLTASQWAFKVHTLRTHSQWHLQMDVWRDIFKSQGNGPRLYCFTRDQIAMHNNELCAR